MHDHWTDDLSEYMDGTLPPDRAASLEAHLEACASCRGVLEELRRVVARAGTVDDIRPPRDLWPGIARSIGAGEGAESGGSVVDISAARMRERRDGERRGGSHGSALRRRFSFTLPQIAAAGLALTLAAGWGSRLLGPEIPADPSTDVRAPGEVRLASDAGDRELGEAAVRVERLERALEAGGDRLAPNTLRILEKNLALIDRAIEESRRALELDPGNAFLKEHLQRAWARKIAYLQDATSLLEL